MKYVGIDWAYRKAQWCALGPGGEVAGGLVQTVRSIVNPDKLRHLGPPADARALFREASGRRAP